MSHHEGIILGPASGIRHDEAILCCLPADLDPHWVHTAPASAMCGRVFEKEDCNGTLDLKLSRCHEHANTHVYMHCIPHYVSLDIQHDAQWVHTCKACAVLDYWIRTYMCVHRMWYQRISAVPLGS